MFIMQKFYKITRKTMESLSKTSCVILLSAFSAITAQSPTQGTLHSNTVELTTSTLRQSPSHNIISFIPQDERNAIHTNITNVCDTLRTLRTTEMNSEEKRTCIENIDYYLFHIQNYVNETSLHPELNQARARFIYRARDAISANDERNLQQSIETLWRSLHTCWLHAYQISPEEIHNQSVAIADNLSTAETIINELPCNVEYFMRLTRPYTADGTYLSTLWNELALDNWNLEKENLEQFMQTIRNIERLSSDIIDHMPSAYRTQQLIRAQRNLRTNELIAVLRKSIYNQNNDVHNYIQRVHQFVSNEASYIAQQNHHLEHILHNQASVSYTISELRRTIRDINRAMNQDDAEPTFSDVITRPHHITPQIVRHISHVLNVRYIREPSTAYLERLRAYMESLQPETPNITDDVDRILYWASWYVTFHNTTSYFDTIISNHETFAGRIIDWHNRCTSERHHIANTPRERERIGRYIAYVDQFNQWHSTLERGASVNNSINRLRNALGPLSAIFQITTSAACTALAGLSQWIQAPLPEEREDATLQYIAETGVNQWQQPLPPLPQNSSDNQQTVTQTNPHHGNTQTTPTSDNTQNTHTGGSTIFNTLHNHITTYADKEIAGIACLTGCGYLAYNIYHHYQEPEKEMTRAQKIKTGAAAITTALASGYLIYSTAANA